MKRQEKKKTSITEKIGALMLGGRVAPMGLQGSEKYKDILNGAQ